MMKKVLLFGAFFAFLGMSAFAQETAEEGVTQEDLTKFANVEVLTAVFVENKTEELKNMILKNEVIEGGARYNEIKAAWGDDAKLTEANVSDEEKAAFQKIQDFQGSLQKGAIEYKTELIKNDSILGVSIYNKVNEARKADPSVKEKLDALVVELKAKADSEKEGTGEGAFDEK